MKTFKEYLYEANYMKFLKRNRNLNDEQRKEINDYFSRVNTQAGSKIDWQSRKIRDWTYDDFMDLKLKYKSGIKSSDKINCRKIKVPGKEGEDYIRLILKQNDFCAFIPLNYETAQFMNTKKFGACQGEWCIGHTKTPSYWNSHVIKNKEVPVYVFNKQSKWIVMIQKGNKTYDVWNLDNNPTKIHEGIPGFSIRKNLLTPRLKKLYDEARELMQKGEIDTEAATDDYNQLITDIEDARNKADSVEIQYYDTLQDIKDTTFGEYEKEQREVKEEIDELESDKEEKEELIDELENEIIDLETEYEDLESVYEDDEDDDIEVRMSDIESEIKEKTDEIASLENDISYIKSEIEDANDRYYDYEYILDAIENAELSELDNVPGVDWSSQIPTIEDFYDDIDIPEIDNGNYETYEEFVEEYGEIYDHDRVNRDIREYVMYYIGGTAEKVLEDNGYYPPEDLIEQA